MWWKECKDLQEEIVAMRRELHKIPELGFNLPKTREFVVKKLDEIGIPYTLSEKDSSVIATMKCGKPGKVLALRADMDALPITEDTGLSFSSTHPGCMHACGHDTHAAMLLGAIKVLYPHREELSGEIRFFFQTAEELAKGSAVVIENGGMEGVDAVFGIHIGSILDKTIPCGTIACIPGPIMASYDRFVLDVKGVGCHASTPEKGVDPINMASHIVLALQTINAREIAATDAGVITMGMIRGGEQYNAIPSTVHIEGTTRALKEEIRQKLAKRIGEIAKTTAEAFGGSVDYTMDWGAPPVINDKDMALFAQDAIRDIFGEHMVTYRENPNMGGEDFALYLQKAPGAFMFLSSTNPAKKTDYPHHNPKFDVDEDVFWMGSASFVAIAEKFLK